MLCLLLNAYLINAQQLVGYEYFFDTDPGVGNANYVSIAPSTNYDANVNLSTASIAGGLHTLCIRFKDDEDNWGVIQSRRFINLEGNGRMDSITMIEAFFDEEPGIGNGVQVAIAPTALLDGTFSIVPPAGITSIHNTYVRVKNAAGLWSHYQVDTADIVLSIDNTELMVENGIKSYPNPASNIIHIDFENKYTGLINMHIMDITGRVVESSFFKKNSFTDKHSIDVSRLISGNYSLTVKTSTGNVLGVAKIVVTR